MALSLSVPTITHEQVILLETSSIVLRKRSAANASPGRTLRLGRLQGYSFLSAAGPILGDGGSTAPQSLAMGQYRSA